MNDQKVQRFLPSEIFLHWANAVLYLLLMCTGLMMLLYRILKIQIIPYETASSIHRIIGILLISVLSLTFILSLFLKGFRQLWKTFLQCLTWNFYDITWLIKVPFNMLLGRVVLPPADRFNAGQKIHLLVIVTVLSGFSVSGITMLIAPGILIAWVIHLICFVPAALFLMLHLFLSLINPETRKSLPAIFTGHVSAKYARLHHPLWLKARETKSHGSYISLRAVIMTGITVIAVIILLVFFSDRKQIYTNICNLISHRGTTLVLPGPLVKSHANDPNLEKCSTCHQSFLEPSTNACLSCHEIIEHRMANQSGYHGTLTDPCISCHPEHLGESVDIRNFDPTQFDHNLANFKLLGRHNQLDCVECHLESTNQIRYIGLSFGKCTDCHRDPHQDRFEQSCTSCHSETGWKGLNLLFSHDSDTDFEIDQIHSHLKCDSCHKDTKPPLFKPLPVTCEKCHDDIDRLMYGIAEATCSEPDPHAGRVTCTQCHLKDSYQQTGTEYANQCKSCHKEAYGQLYYDWNQSFENYALQVNKLVLELRGDDMPQSIAMIKRIKEAKKTSFHNIQLTNELWDQILSDTLLLSE